MRRFIFYLYHAAALGFLLSGSACLQRRPEPIGRPLLVNSPELKNGQEKFMTYCNKCHPGGEAGLGPSINGNPAPRFVKAFQIRQGLGAMPAFKKNVLPKKDVRDITLYLKDLRRHSK